MDSKRLEFVISAVERVLPTMQRVQAAMQKSGSAIQQVNAAVQKSSEAASAALKQTADGAQRTAAALRQMQPAAAAAAAGLKQVGGAAGQATTATTAGARQAQSALQGVANTARQAAAQVRSVGGGRAGGAGGGLLGAGLGEGLGSALKGLSGIASTVLGGIGDLLLGLGRTALQVAQSIAGALVSALGSLATASAAAAAVIGGTLLAGMVAVGKAGVDMNVTLRGAQTALTTITGSSAGAARLIGELRQEAASSVLTFKDLLPMGQGLAAVYGPQGLGKVLPTLRAFGDAGAILEGGNQGKIQQALTQFRQLAGGMLELENLKSIQENLAGSDVLGIVTRKFGTTDTKELKAAGVTGAMVADAIVEGFTQRFGGAQQRMAGTLPVILSNFTDAFNDFSSVVVARFTPMVEGALGKALAAFQQLSNNGSLIEALAVPFELVGKAIEAGAAALPGFVEWLTQIVTKESVVNLLANVAGFIGAIRTEIERFIGAATNGQGLVGIWEAFQKAATTAIDTVLKVWSGLVSTIQFFAENSGKVFSLVVTAIDTVKAAFEALVGVATIAFGILAVEKIAGIVGGFVSLAGAIGGAGAAMARFLPYLSHVQVTNEKGQTTGEIIGRKILGDKRWNEITGGSGKWEALKPGGREAAEKAGFSGPLGALQGLGHSVIGAGADAANGLLQALPKDLRDLASGAQAAFERGFKSGGIAPFMAEQQRQAAGARNMLNGVLGGGKSAPSVTAAPGSDLPPMPLFGAQSAAPGATGASAGVSVGSKKLKDILEARLAYFNSLVEQAEAAAEAAPDEQEALARVQVVVPALRAKQAELIEQAKRVRADSDDFFKLRKAYFDIEKEISQSQDRALKQAATNQQKAQEAAKKAYDDQAKGADLAVKLQEAQMKNLAPDDAFEFKHNRLIPMLQEKFKFLTRGRSGETFNEMLGRKLELEQTRGAILDAEGVGEKAREGVKVLGGGRVGLFDRRHFNSVNRYLDQLQSSGEAAGNYAPMAPGTGAGMRGGAPVLQANGPVTITPPAGPMTKEQFIQWMSQIAAQVFDVRSTQLESLSNPALTY